MVTRGLLVRLEARHGKEKEVAALLHSCMPMVHEENGTKAWFAMQYGRGKFGIFDAFEDEEARDAHLHGAVTRELGARAADLLVESPHVNHVDLLGAKLQQIARAPTKALMLTFHAQYGHDDDVAGYLREAEHLVDAEPKTTAWFGFHCRDIRAGGGVYGIFDVFPDNAGRFAHLTGRVPRGLAKQGFNLMRDFPEIRMVDLLETKLPH